MDQLFGASGTTRCASLKPSDFAVLIRSKRFFPVMSKRTMLYNILRMVAWRWLWRQNQWVTCTQETLDELVKTKSDAAPSTQDISLPISSTNFVSFMVATWDCLHLLGSACQMFSAFVRQLLQATVPKGRVSRSQNQHENVPVEKVF